MRSLLTRVLLIPFLALLATYSYAAEKFTLDPQHSYVRWEVSHFGFSSPSGKWLANGTLDLDEKDPSKSKVEVTIDVENIVLSWYPEIRSHTLQMNLKKSFKEYHQVLDLNKIFYEILVYDILQLYPHLQFLLQYRQFNKLILKYSK